MSGVYWARRHIVLLFDQVTEPRSAPPQISFGVYWAMRHAVLLFDHVIEFCQYRLYWLGVTLFCDLTK